MEKKQLHTIVKDISYQYSKRMAIFRELELKEQVKVIKLVTKNIRRDLIKKLDQEEIRLILEQFDPVEAADILQLMSKKKREAVVETLNEALKKDIALLLSFDPDTAAGLMSLDYIQAQEDDSIETVAEKVKKYEQRTGKLPTILITSDEKLTGFLPGHKLVFAKPHEKAGEFISKIPTLKHSTSEKEVLRFFRKNSHRKVAVMGERENVLGVIYSDDILKILQEKASASLYNFAGVREEESIYDSAKVKINFRYKWLILNLGTAFLAAFTVGLFESTIAKEVLLAVYMPIVAGMGGNAGTQTLAVMVRGIDQQDLGKKEIWHIFKNEVGAGFVNGLINGLIVFTVILLFNHNLLVATVLGIAMIVNLLIAASAGTVVPVMMKKLGKDPAASATIFITTATDIFGFFAFLGLATLLLR
jgi:magnesium transporter